MPKGRLKFMFKIAIIQFPGLNTEFETRREINRAGMRGEFFRWNESPEKLAKYDGYVIGGGFSYEDRGRAGVVASLDPIMKTIKEQAAAGKPVLGVCNGAQILVESGLIPGVDGTRLAMSLARNKRVRDGEVLGTGYYNTWTNLKCVTPKGNCMFTYHMHEGEMLAAPIAHGEGRFVSVHASLFEQLKANGQMVLRYCDKQGAMTEQFPINPNGSSYNLAAICNPEGNVMAVMPHLERDSDASFKMFTSLKDAMTARKTGGGGLRKKVPKLSAPVLKTFPLPTYSPASKTFALYVSLKITDNEADTFEMALGNLGFSGVQLRRKTHVEVSYQGKPDLEKLGKKIVQSGIVLNTNKEVAQFSFDEKKPKWSLFGKKGAESADGVMKMKILVRERQDFVGMSKLSTFNKRLKMEEITSVTTGTLWEISIMTKSKTAAADTFKKILATNLFFNPHRQDAFSA